MTDVPFRFVIPGSPRTKKNHPRIVTRKRDGRQFIIQSDSSKGWEKDAILLLRSQWRGKPPIDGPVSLRALVFLDRAVGDLGNYLAAICDALERAGIVSNDRFIMSFDGSRLRIDRERPRVEVEIGSLPDEFLLVKKVRGKKQAPATPVPYLELPFGHPQGSVVDP